mmetsp:Transcript_63572/g.175318  ORF Transcript_63572/g.175318 Transcript_63572/m.175318 type:complete len:511 (-) Transcript_63572:915-2447(-)
MPSRARAASCVALAALMAPATVVVGWSPSVRLASAAAQRRRNVASAASRRVTPTAAYDHEVDVAVVGGGPAGYAMAALMSSAHGASVALVDPNPEGCWPNNYGEWREEWQRLSERLGMPELMDCVTREWEITDTFFGGSFGAPWDERTRLNRAYVQVDRQALKELLSNKIATSGRCEVISAKLNAKLVASNIFDNGIVHDSVGSTLTLSTGATVRAKVVLDATGFESKLVAREAKEVSGNWEELEPGYQIAYGFACELEDGLGPYDANAMTLFDYRTDHFDEGSTLLADAENRPTFVYVMPQGEQANGRQKAFFEETSLVGRGERRLGFAECKKRLDLRLKHLGVKVVPGTIEEEEFCYIPMGGALPDLTQRVVAVGGAAATVHPSTGYQLCRMLASSTDIAAALSQELAAPSFSPDCAAAAAYRSIWSPSLRLQRDFQVYGGEFLMAQPVEKLRGFFSAFFKLDTILWGGFLAGWPVSRGAATRALLAPPRRDPPPRCRTITPPHRHAP